MLSCRWQNISSFWVSANFRNHNACLGDKKLSKNAYVTIIYIAAGLFEREMACQNRNVLFLLDQRSAQNNNDPTLKHVMPVVFTSQHHMQVSDSGISYCMKQANWRGLVYFLLQEIDRNFSGVDVRKLNILDTLNVVLLWQDNPSCLPIWICA